MLSIVIPTYNEEKNISILYKSLKSVLSKYQYEIIFVDDGSTDRTFDVLSNINNKDKKVKVIKFRRNFGQTAAIDAGFKNSKGDIIITMDADLQNDSKDIPKLLFKMKEGYDVVSGWRYKRKDNFMKKFFSKISNSLRTLLTGEKLHDSGCSLKAYKKKCVKDLDLYGETHRFIPALLTWKGYKIGEIKVNHRPRKYGKTKYGLKRLIRGFLDLLVVLFWQKYSTRPIHLFGSFGLILFVIGMVLGSTLVILRLFFGVLLANRTSPLLAVTLVLLGVQFFLFGILADISIKNYYKGIKKNYSIEKIVR